MTALIGRDGELAAVVERLDDHRLVTLVGPGGIGKTTIARAVADDQGDRFPLGAHFVDLTLVDESEAVGGILAAQLGFPSFTALLDSPTDQPALLVVDNCEHVLDAAAEAVDALLGSCEAPSIIATSRSPLDLPGESVVALGPLRDEEDSVQLFLDRSRSAGTELGEDQRGAVVHLCRALDGVPLALEIAAARTRVLTPAEILERMGDLDTLARPRFRGAERHRTLRATIEWSYVQLDEADRARFDRLGVLAGPFTAATAHAVTGEDGEDDLATLDGLAALVRSSLLVAEPDGDVTRYRLLSTLRTFALERLAEREELDATWSRFADHITAIAEDLMPSGRSTWRPGALRDLLDLADDLLSTLRWAVAHEDDAARSFTLLGRLWSIIHQSHMEDTAALGEAALARWPEPTHPAWADAAATVATCRHLLGRPVEAVELAETARQAGGRPSPLAACALPRAIGRARTSLGDPTGAAAAFGETIAVAEEVGLLPFAREGRTLLAVSLAEQGQVEEARTLLEDTRAEAAEAGDQTNELWAGIVGAFLALRERPAEAEATFAEVVEAARSVQFASGIVSSLQGLALARLAIGDDDGARSTLVELFDEMTTGGGVSEPRSALRAAAVVLHRADHDGWTDLATTAEQLPQISAFASIGPELFPLPAANGRILATGDALSRARHALERGSPPTNVQRPPPPDRPTAGARFRRSGDAWQVSWGGRDLTVRTSKGMVDLARLLAAPGQEIHCLELAGAATQQGSTGEVIDDTARREYEQRIRDLQAEIDEAETNHDHARADRAQVEFDAIVEHLAAALGLGGRARRGGSTAERARSAVTHRIRATVRRLGDDHPGLGRHLSDSITTGTYCVYRPADDVAWEL